ncbi:hypothetical protein AB0K09_12955 [Streptomyces sp. NPDC049577]|uniref:hypothetical protein n=1 Tax=Streptomyces sp. NPDC049577 TaxID=3155153 RepID=UPI003436DB86
MPGHHIDTFFTVVSATTEETLRIGHVVQGGRVARWNWTGDRMYDVDAVPLGRRWPQLPEAFRQGFDAALTTPADNPWTWVFRGGQCLRLHPVDGTVSEVTTIAARFPGLPGAFAQGVDAALPGTGVNEVYLFSGDQCALYDLRVPAPVEVKPIADVWTGLAAKAPEFVHGLDAATYDPGTGSCYLFRGGEYVRGVLATTTIEVGAAPVDNTTWVGLLPAFTRGHVIVSSLVGHIRALDLETGVSSPLQTASDGWPTASPDGRYIHILRPGPYGYQSRYDMATGQRSNYSGTRMDAARVAFARDGGLMYFVPRGDRNSLTIADAVASEPHFVDSIALGYAGTATLETGDGGPGAQPPQQDGSQEEGKDGLEFDPDWPVAPPVVLAPEGDMAYVGSFRSAQNNIPARYVILEVDLIEKRVRQHFNLPDAGAPLDVAIDASGRIAHVAQERGTCALNLDTGEVDRQGVLPPCRQLKLTPDGRELWCLPAAEHGGVLVADPADQTVLRRVPVGENGLGTAFSLDFNHYGTYAYVLMRGTVAVVDVAARRTSVIHRIDADQPSRLAYTTY